MGIVVVVDGRRGSGLALMLGGGLLVLVGAAGAVLQPGSAPQTAFVAGTPTPSVTRTPETGSPLDASPTVAASSTSAATPAETLPTATPATPAMSPTLAPTPTTTPSATIAPSATPDVDGLARAFLGRLAAAIQAGTTETLVDELHQAVIDRYGLKACRTELSAVATDPSYAVEVVSVEGPAAWDYTTDGRTTTIPTALTVNAVVTSSVAVSPAPTTVPRVIHLALVDGAIRWFTDCGSPG
jgi:hypothetical protein